MKTLLSFVAFFVLTIASFGQSFEGKIIFTNVYKSKLPNFTDDQLTAMMGSRQEYYIKDGDYKSIMDGSLVQWQLYVNRDNKLFNKMSNSETIIWNDGAVNVDEVLKAEINNAVTTIAGYTCDELILTCKSGTQKYYYSSRLAVNPELFVNHKFGNWYELVSRSKALPLKTVVENAQFNLESTASEITAEKLSKQFFELAPGVQTMKSPY